MNTEDLFQCMMKGLPVYVSNALTKRFKKCKIDMVGKTASRLLYINNQVVYRKNSEIRREK